MLFRMILTTSLVCLLAATMASADVYRCQNAAGKVRYSDGPCASGESASLIKEPPGTRPPPPPAPPAGASHLTTQDAMACHMPWWLQEWQAAREHKDSKGQEHLVSSGKCFVPKPGLAVSVLSETSNVPTARLHVRLYVPDSDKTIEVWMAPWHIMSVKR